jgi:hypothetical protein
MERNCMESQTNVKKKGEVTWICEHFGWQERKNIRKVARNATGVAGREVGLTEPRYDLICPNAL